MKKKTIEFWLNEYILIGVAKNYRMGNKEKLYRNLLEY
jgi:hypothetical protein